MSQRPGDAQGSSGGNDRQGGSRAPGGCGSGAGHDQGVAAQTFKPQAFTLTPKLAAELDDYSEDENLEEYLDDIMGSLTEPAPNTGSPARGGGRPGGAGGVASPLSPSPDGVGSPTPRDGRLSVVTADDDDATLNSTGTANGSAVAAARRRFGRNRKVSGFGSAFDGKTDSGSPTAPASNARAASPKVIDPALAELQEKLAAPIILDSLRPSREDVANMLLGDMRTPFRAFAPFGSPLGGGGGGRSGAGKNRNGGAGSTSPRHAGRTKLKKTNSFLASLELPVDDPSGIGKPLKDMPTPHSVGGGRGEWSKVADAWHSASMRSRIGLGESMVNFGGPLVGKNRTSGPGGRRGSQRMTIRDLTESLLQRGSSGAPESEEETQDWNEHIRVLMEKIVPPPIPASVAHLLRRKRRAKKISRYSRVGGGNEWDSETSPSGGNSPVPDATMTTTTTAGGRDCPSIASRSQSPSLAATGSGLRSLHTTHSASSKSLGQTSGQAAAPNSPASRSLEFSVELFGHTHGQGNASVKSPQAHLLSLTNGSDAARSAPLVLKSPQEKAKEPAAQHVSPPPHALGGASSSSKGGYGDDDHPISLTSTANDVLLPTVPNGSEPGSPNRPRTTSSSSSPDSSDSEESVHIHYGSSEERSGDRSGPNRDGDVAEVKPAAVQSAGRPTTSDPRRRLSPGVKAMEPKDLQRPGSSQGLLPPRPASSKPTASTTLATVERSPSPKGHGRGATGSAKRGLFSASQRRRPNTALAIRAAEAVRRSSPAHHRSGDSLLPYTRPASTPFSRSAGRTKPGGVEAGVKPREHVVQASRIDRPLTHEQQMTVWLQGSTRPRIIFADGLEDLTRRTGGGGGGGGGSGAPKTTSQQANAKAGDQGNSDDPLSRPRSAIKAQSSSRPMSALPPTVKPIRNI
jgi:hypothetical protein